MGDSEDSQMDQRAWSEKHKSNIHRWNNTMSEICFKNNTVGNIESHLVWGVGGTGGAGSAMGVGGGGWVTVVG